MNLYTLNYLLMVLLLSCEYRCFIVIDDIWDTKSWEIIKLALVDNNSGSIIIITTRKHEVAREAGEVYELQPLSDDILCKDIWC